MPATIRTNIDNSAGHCFSPRPPDEGSPNVFINDKSGVSGITYASTRVGDHYPTHCCGDPCHDGNASGGSPDVFVNNKAIHRNGDAIDCGDTAANGSPDVFANGD